MFRAMAGIVLLMCICLHGCASAGPHDMCGVAASPFENCKSIAGTYRDEMDFGAPYDTRRHGPLSLWEFLTLSPEADSTTRPSEKTVTISNCTESGFDAYLSGPTPEHVHLRTTFRDGYFFIDRRCRLVPRFFFVEVRDFASGIGRAQISNGLSLYANGNDVGFLAIVPLGGNTSLTLSATFPPVVTVARKF